MPMIPCVERHADDRSPARPRVEAIPPEPLRQEERALEVGVHHVVPLGPGHLDHRLVQGASGIVDQEIDLAEPASARVEGRLDARLLAQVEPHRHHLAAAQVRDAAAAPRASRCRARMIARSKPSRASASADGAADAGRCAGHEGASSVTHCPSFMLRWQASANCTSRMPAASVARNGVSVDDVAQEVLPADPIRIAIQDRAPRPRSSRRDSRCPGSTLTLKCATGGVAAALCVQQRCRPAIAEPCVPSTCRVRRSSRRTRVAHDDRMVPRRTVRKLDQGGAACPRRRPYSAAPRSSIRSGVAVDADATTRRDRARGCPR